VAAHALIGDPKARVLALYPARALIQDQFGKWERFLQPFGLRAGVIDGGIPVPQRAAILSERQVILMTPDVAHAWLLCRAGDGACAKFLERLRLVVLDEAHVYDGVFGTNMAYFLRRLDAAAAEYRLVATTATLGKPGEFIRVLTGREAVTIGLDDDASPAPVRTILLANGIDRRSFQTKADFLKAVAQEGLGRFLAFGDSRRMVERMVVTALRRPETNDDEPTDTTEDEPRIVPGEILPYRAGYETEDRNEIQTALTRGSLAGVVSTSALELGLDIGDIDLVVLLNPPTSTKALWQRLGRTGRARPGVCVLIDDSGVLVDRGVSLRQYLAQEIEPNWLYLDNRYIQYTNALCAAHELRGAGSDPTTATPFTSLPENFRRMVENELNPTELVPDDLYPLKQRAQAGPHHEFALRSDIEPNFQVLGPFGRRLGTLSYGQVLREAYPGAVYYYMAKPYRAIGLRQRQQEIIAKREKYLTTHPLAQTMVFPRFAGGILSLARSRSGFVTEVEVQVSERVLGFKEKRGDSESDHLYGPNSAYSQRELTRFFPTTGVCWFFPEKPWISERIGRQILDAFCASFGVQPRDVGLGPFHANGSPIGSEKCQGMCLFDATHGSLRLTQRLAERFAEVLDTARAIALGQQDDARAAELAALRDAVGALEAAPAGPAGALSEQADDECVTVIAPGGAGMLVSGGRTGEVTVRGHRYTPRGLLYELGPEQPGVTWLVVARDVRPIFGKSPLVRLNLVTGESFALAS
jgi:DEAD/DEAH box helicase domain-containing protein